MNKLRKGDEIIVITGRDKGKRGVITGRTGPQHVIVEGINVVKKHQKPNPMRGQAGGIVDKSMPIEQSNVAIFNPETQKADRVGVSIAEDGTKSRIFRSTGKPIPAPAGA